MTLDLSSLPRLRFAHLPTPLEELEVLGRELGTRLFVKRDDCTGLAFGGNKTRKLEFALADALERGADAIITCGGLQSNHVRQTAAAAARLGLPCHVVLDNPLPQASTAYRESGNRLLDDVLGAVVHEVDAAEVDASIAKLAETLNAEGRTPYVVPLGASDGVGALGYVDCARELVAQCEVVDLRPSHVFHATGSAGTQGGLLTGLRLLGSPIAVVGVAVSETAAVKRAKVRDIVDQVQQVLELPESPVADEDILVLDGYVGAGYGVRTEAADEAIRRLARTEGLLLDPVYTGKAMAGMLDVLATRSLGELRDPLFLHTGGTPALFAYS